ncbi:MAG: ABC transporter permease, partial [Clostridia bacterium]|nr:ABC transporter permease [Clostridia bacterium]
GLLIGSLCTEKSIGGASTVVIVGQSVLSGMWFPIEGLNGVIISIMNVLPFRNATLLLENVLNGINDSYKDFLLPFLIVLGYTVVSFVFAILAFRKKMNAD